MDSGSSGHHIRALAGVAGHLASALDALSLSGCDWFTADILDMLAVIEGQIAVLEQLADDDAVPGLSG